MRNIKAFCLFIAFVFSCNTGNSRIVATAGYEGPYQNRPDCHKIWVMVYDMSTMPDGTHIGKRLGMGYFISGQCKGADYPSSKSCGQITMQDAVIFNHQTDTAFCISDLISSNEAVARMYIAAGENAVHELKNKHVSSAPIDAVFNRDQRVLHLRLQFPDEETSSYTLRMIDQSGKEVYSQGWGTTGRSSEYSIDTQGFPKGRYRLELSGNMKLIAAQDIPLY